MSLAARMYALAAKARAYAFRGFRYVFSSFWHAIAVITVTIIGFRVLWEVLSGTYTIEFQDVPETLVKRGLRKEGLAVRVRDQVAAMQAQGQAEQAQAQRDIQLHAAVIEKTTPDIKIAGTEIPMRYVASEIRNLFGYPLQRLSGLIFENDPETATQQSSADTDQNPTTFRLVLNKIDKNEIQILDTSGSLDTVIDEAAFETLRELTL